MKVIDINSISHTIGINLYPVRNTYFNIMFIAEETIQLIF